MRSIKKAALIATLALVSATTFASGNKGIPRTIKCNPSRPSSKQCTAADGRELTSLSPDSDVVEQGTYALSSSADGTYVYSNVVNPAEVVQFTQNA